MSRTGILNIQLGETSLDGTLLARTNGVPNPLAAATNFVQDLGFGSGNRVRVEGDQGPLDGVTVIFITGIQAAPMGVGFAPKASPKPAKPPLTGRKKPTTKPVKKPVKKSGKRSAKKSAKKRNAKRASKPKATKRPRR